METTRTLAEELREIADLDYLTDREERDALLRRAAAALEAKDAALREAAEWIRDHEDSEDEDAVALHDRLLAAALRAGEVQS